MSLPPPIMFSPFVPRLGVFVLFLCAPAPVFSVTPAFLGDSGLTPLLSSSGVSSVDGVSNDIRVLRSGEFVHRGGYSIVEHGVLARKRVSIAREHAVFDDRILSAGEHPPAGEQPQEPPRADHHHQTVRGSDHHHHTVGGADHQQTADHHQTVRGADGGTEETGEQTKRSSEGTEETGRKRAPVPILPAGEQRQPPVHQEPPSQSSETPPPPPQEPPVPHEERRSPQPVSCFSCFKFVARGLGSLLRAGGSGNNSLQQNRGRSFATEEPVVLKTVRCAAEEPIRRIDLAEKRWMAMMLGHEALMHAVVTRLAEKELELQLKELYRAAESSPCAELRGGSSPCAELRGGSSPCAEMRGGSSPGAELRGDDGDSSCTSNECADTIKNKFSEQHPNKGPLVSIEPIELCEEIFDVAVARTPSPARRSKSVTSPTTERVEHPVPEQACHVAADCSHLCLLRHVEFAKIMLREQPSPIMIRGYGTLAPGSTASAEDEAQKTLCVKSLAMERCVCCLGGLLRAIEAERRALLEQESRQKEENNAARRAVQGAVQAGRPMGGMAVWELFKELRNENSVVRRTSEFPRSMRGARKCIFEPQVLIEGILKPLLRGLKFLHTRGILHRDLNMELLYRCFEFGVSKTSRCSGATSERHRSDIGVTSE